MCIHIQEEEDSRGEGGMLLSALAHAGLLRFLLAHNSEVSGEEGVHLAPRLPFAALRVLAGPAC